MNFKSQISDFKLPGAAAGVFDMAVPKVAFRSAKGCGNFRGAKGNNMRK
jgi:hypothetical protein